MTSFIVEQKLTAFVNKYSIYAVGPDGQKGGLICLAQQKRLAFKEEILFYADEAKTTLAFKVKAEKVIDFHGKFIVRDAQDNELGRVRKAFKASLFRSTWEMLDVQDNVISTVTEENAGLAVLRRVWDMVPIVGDLPFFFKYHFVFYAPGAATIQARYTKTTLLRDHYRLDTFDDGLISQVGWQTLVAQCVLLDALQGR
ncbi:hypothetical protein JNJ66_01180 [Candidatus Saccharibacteria bacterium]|nr:hypothetical protein [Candidatus Saccharibacteria bacterium]